MSCKKCKYYKGTVDVCGTLVNAPSCEKDNKIHKLFTPSCFTERSYETVSEKLDTLREGFEMNRKENDKLPYTCVGCYHRKQTAKHLPYRCNITKEEVQCVLNRGCYNEEPIIYEKKWNRCDSYVPVYDCTSCKHWVTDDKIVGDKRTELSHCDVPDKAVGMTPEVIHGCAIHCEHWEHKQDAPYSQKEFDSYNYVVRDSNGEIIRLTAMNVCDILKSKGNTITEQIEKAVKEECKKDD